MSVCTIYIDAFINVIYKVSGLHSCIFNLSKTEVGNLTRATFPLMFTHRFYVTGIFILLFMEKPDDRLQFQHQIIPLKTPLTLFLCVWLFGAYNK